MGKWLQEFIYKFPLFISFCLKLNEKHILEIKIHYTACFSKIYSLSNILELIRQLSSFNLYYWSSIMLGIPNTIYSIASIYQIHSCCSQEARFRLSVPQNFHCQFVVIKKKCDPNWPRRICFYATIIARTFLSLLVWLILPFAQTKFCSSVL